MNLRECTVDEENEDGFLLVVVGVGGVALERELQARIVVLDGQKLARYFHSVQKSDVVQRA